MSHEKQNAVLNFWFGEDPTQQINESEKWFKKDDAFDAEIRSRFESWVQEAARGGFDSWSKTARGSLALIILLDQFPRNIYRGQPASFEFDPHARRTAEIALDHGFDQELSPIERSFMYLPLEHSEDLTAQNRSLELYEKLAAHAPGNESKLLKGNLEFAKRHREIIERFGRFPHRNEILGRTSTQIETEFLKNPNSGF